MGPISCPYCGRVQVHSEDPTLTRCPACGRALELWVVKMMKEITSLPEATGTHSCEKCGHPQMRRLPDETFWCPGCGQDVLSLEATLTLWEFRQESEAYRRGWLDGYLLGEAANVSSSAQWAREQGVHEEERPDYYRGHNAGFQELFFVGRTDLHRQRLRRGCSPQRSVLRRA